MSDEFLQTLTQDLISQSKELKHWGVKGMKWGVRRDLRKLAPEARDDYLRSKEGPKLAKINEALKNPKVAQKVHSQMAAAANKEIGKVTKAYGVKNESDFVKALADPKFEVEVYQASTRGFNSVIKKNFGESKTGLYDYSAKYSITSEGVLQTQATLTVKNNQKIVDQLKSLQHSGVDISENQITFFFEVTVNESGEPVVRDGVIHFGVKGMKWGVIRSKEQKAADRAFIKDAKASRSSSQAKVLSGKGTIRDAHVLSVKSKGRRTANAVLGDRTYWKRAGILTAGFGIVAGKALATGNVSSEGIMRATAAFGTAATVNNANNVVRQTRGNTRIATSSRLSDTQGISNDPISSISSQVKSYLKDNGRLNNSNIVPPDSDDDLTHSDGEISLDDRFKDNVDQGTVFYAVLQGYLDKTPLPSIMESKFLALPKDLQDACAGLIFLYGVSRVEHSDNDLELIHWGVKGMKWGVRRPVGSDGLIEKGAKGKPTSEVEGTSSSAPKEKSSSEIAKASLAEIQNMSTEELQVLTARINLESNMAKALSTLEKQNVSDRAKKIQELKEIQELRKLEGIEKEANKSATRKFADKMISSVIKTASDQVIKSLSEQGSKAIKDYMDAATNHKKSDSKKSDSKKSDSKKSDSKKKDDFDAEAYDRWKNPFGPKRSKDWKTRPSEKASSSSSSDPKPSQSKTTVTQVVDQDGNPVSSPGPKALGPSRRKP